MLEKLLEHRQARRCRALSSANRNEKGAGLMFTTVLTMAEQELIPAVADNPVIYNVKITKFIDKC